MILPTVGAKVFFFRIRGHTAMKRLVEGNQPFPATICYVHNERKVNVRVIDNEGNAYPVCYAQLLQDGDLPPEDTDYYCSWLPYVKKYVDIEQLKLEFPLGVK